MEDRREQLYNNLLHSGKVTEDEIGTLDDFRSAIKDEASAKQFHKNLLGVFNEDEIGDEKAFLGSIADDFKVKDPIPQTTPVDTVETDTKNVSQEVKDYALFHKPDFLKPKTVDMFGAHDKEKSAFDLSNEGRSYEMKQARINSGAMEEGTAQKAYNSIPDQMEKLASIRQKNDVGKAESAREANKGLFGVTSAAYMRGKSNDTDAQLDYANKLLEDAQKVTEAAQSGDNFMKGLGRGLKDEAFNLNNWLMGIEDAKGGKQAVKTLEKLDRGEELTEAEQSLVDALVTNAAVTNFYSQKLGRGYKAGQTTGASLPFMLDMLTSVGSMSAATKSAGKGLLKYIASKTASHSLKRNLAKGAYGLGKGIVDATLHTATAGMPRVMADYGQRGIGDVKYDSQGNYDGREGQESGLTAAAKAFISTGLETQSELIGEQFAPVTKFVGSQLMKLPGLRSIPSNKIGDFFKSIDKNKGVQEFKELAKHTGFHGVFNEYAEEVYNNLGSTIIGDMTPEQLVDLDQNIDTFLGVSVMSAAFGTMGSAAYARDRYRNRKRMKAYEESMRSVDPNFDSWKDQLSNLDIEGAKNFINYVLKDNTLSPEEKTAEIQYINETLREHVAASSNEDAEAAEMVQQAYENGAEVSEPADKHNILRDYEDAVNALGGNSSDANEKQQADYIMSLDDNPIEAIKKLQEEGFSEEQIEVAGNYYAAKIRMDGLSDSMQSNIDEQVEEANNQVISNVNQDMGGVVPVVLADGTEANLIRGTVLVDDEGNIDINQSDDKIFVRLQDGTVKMMNPHKDLSGRGEIMDPAALVEQNESVLRDQLTQQGANEIDYAPGTPEPVVGAQFSINGKPFVVSNVSEDGGQLSIVPSDAWQTAQGDEKKMQELIQVSSQQMIPTSEYKKYVSDMIDAGGQEQQANIPEVQEQNTTQQVDSSSIPTREDGTVDFVTYGADNTRKMLSDKYGDKYSHKVEVTRNAAAKELEKAQKAVEKAQMAVDEAPIGKEAKAEKALSKAQAEYNAIKAEHELWSQLDEENKFSAAETSSEISEAVQGEEVQAGTETPSYAVDESGEPIFDQIPTEQAVSMMDELGDNAPAFIDSNVFAAEKAFKKAMSMKPKATSFNALRKEQQEIAAMQSEAKRVLDAWTAIKDGYTAAHTQSAAFTPKAEGLSRTRTLSNGTKLKGRYVLVSAEDLIPSHNPMDGWKSTEGFPLNEKGQNINDRDYEHDKDAQKFTEQIAQNYGGQAVEQVPTISREGIVYDGNGRVMAGQMAAANKTDAEYMRSLHENAEMFGFTQDQIDNVPNARVVFMLDENLPYTTETFAQFNAQEKKSQSNTEKAVAHSKKLSEESVMQIASVIDEYNTLDSFFGSEKGIAEILRTLQDNGILSANEIAGLKEGELLNAQGREFVTSLLLGAVFDEKAIRQLGSLPALKNTMLRAIKSIIANRQLKEYALTEEISNAISLLYEAKKAGMKLDLFMRQTNMFEDSVSDRFNEFEMMLAAAIESGVDNFRDILNVYNQQGSLVIGGQMNIFDGGVTSKEELKNLILEHYGKESETDTSADSGRQENHAGERIQEGDEQEGSTEESAGTETIGSEGTGTEVVTLLDNQGNPIRDDGTYILEKVNSIDDITDDDFVNPTRNIELPQLPNKVSEAIGIGDKAVIIKKNIFEKNKKSHKDLTPSDGRKILNDVFFHADLYGKNQKATRPYNWILIHLNDMKHSAVVLELNELKDNVEVINWHFLEADALERKKRQAIREGGLILTLSKDDVAANTPKGLTGNNKDSEASDEKQETNAKKGENDITSTEEQVVEETKELTEEEINASDLDESMKIGAIAYLHGDRSSAVVMSYQIVKDYVRNQSRTGAADSSNANEAQLGSGTDEAAGRESGQSGINGSGLDREEGDGTLSGTVSSGETGENSVASPAGKRSNRKVGGRKSDKGNERSGDIGGRSGGSVRSDGRDVRGQQGHSDSEGISGKDGVRGTETRHSEDSADDIISSALGDIKDILSHPLQLPKDRFYDATSLVAALGVNAVKLFTATARLGYGLVLKGFHSYQKWQGQMHNNLDTILKENTKLTDAQIDEFIKSMWDYPTKFKGEIHKVSEWADMLAQEEMRKMISMSVEEKKKLQKAAEKTPTIIGDLDNIRESLPFLLPDQQKDVQLAENQFFDKSHSDAAHGNGKGYMFTNGTGTGKTYTGLGIVKRFIKQGKGRILIVTAQDKKIQDWIHDAENLGIKATMLENTTSKGKGVVVTQYANIRQNYELLKDEFDLIVYDESHKLMENQSGQLTTTATFHHMLANRDVEQALLRQLQNTPLWVKERQLLAESKELEQLTEAMNKSNPSREVEDEFIRRGGTDGVSRRYNEIHVELNNVKESQEEELKKQKANEKAREQAQNAVNKTKVVFLSATPFNTASSLDYVESYIFSYPQQDNASITRDKRRNSFIMQNFPSSHTRNSKGEIQRLGEGSISDPEAASKEEVVFSDHLQNDLNTMSGRMLDTTYDYSREFPELDMPQAKRFNQAVQELTNGKYAALQPYFKHLLSNYPEMTALFEAIKTAGSINRIREHIKLGRKVVVFHRRISAKEPLEPPFDKGLRLAAQEKDKSIQQLANQFESEFFDLLNWEQTINLDFPHNQIVDAFATSEDRKRYSEKVEEWLNKVQDAQAKGKPMPQKPRLEASSVRLFNGTETNNYRNAATGAFNDDNSDVKVIVVQVQSGKEGISLHDTTGKHQRVELSLQLPQSPIEFIQAEGRIYRVGNKSDAIFEYPLLGINIELASFAGKINGRSQTSENLALGSQARGLRESIARAALSSRRIPVEKGQGVGGKKLDSKALQNATGFDVAKENYTQWSAEPVPSNLDDVLVPDPIGFKMIEWGELTNGEEVLVPFAGTGTIARYAPTSAKLTALEGKMDRYSRLVALLGGGGRKIETTGFKDYSVYNKADCVVINGTHDEAVMDNGGMQSSDEFNIVKSARHLEDGGRMIAVVDEKNLKAATSLLDHISVFVKRGEIKLPAVAMGGHRTSIIIYDRIDKPDNRKLATESVNEDFSSVDDLNELFEKLRSVTAPARIIDKTARVKKRVNKFIKEIEKSSFISSRRFQGKSEKSIAFSDSGIYITFKNGTISMPIPGYGSSNYRNFQLDFEKLINDTPSAISYQQEAAQLWQYLKDNTTMSDSDLRSRYLYRKNDAVYDEIRELSEVLKNFIAAAMNKTDTQMDNIARGERENKISGELTFQQYKDAFKSLNSGDAGLDALAEKVFDVVEKIDGMTFRAVSKDRMSGHNVAAHYVPSRNCIELNGDFFNTIKVKDSFKSSTIVHEMIHAVTCYYMEAYQSGAQLPQNIKEACKDIFDVYEHINNNEFRSELRIHSKLEDNAEYGLTNPEEMMAELANPIFRAQLKAKKLWRQLVNGIKRLLGMDVVEGPNSETDALTVLDNALNTLLDNYDPQVYKNYVGGNVMFNLSPIKANPQAEYQAEFNQGNFNSVGDGTNVEKEFHKRNEIIKNLHLYSESLRGIKKTSHFISDIKQILELNSTGASSYGRFTLHDGTQVSIRISNHSANAGNYVGSRNNVEHNNSIVISSKRSPNRFVSDDNIELSEYVYIKERLASSDKDCLSQIVNSIAEMLKTGEYHDTTGLVITHKSSKKEDNNLFRSIPSFDDSHIDIYETSEGYSAEGLSNTYQSKSQLLDAFRDKYPNYFVTLNDNKLEISNWNEESAEETKRSKKDQREFDKYLERKTRNAKKQVKELASSLGLNVDVKESLEGLEGRKAKAKGWFDTDTGKIVIVLPNHTNVEDVLTTVLHEGVAHYGLRKLYGIHFDTFLDNVYNHVTDDVRHKINVLAARNGWNHRLATEEYLASMAEDINYERAVKSGVWKTVRAFLVKMLAKAGFNVPNISDNELRYILWRSYDNLKHPGKRSILGVAEDIATQDRLGVGNYAKEDSSAAKVAEDNLRFRSDEKDSIRYRMNNDNAREFQSLVDKHLKKYKSQEVIVVEASMTDEQLRKIFDNDETPEIIRDALNEGTLGCHYKETDKVVIFADNNEPQLIEETLFHENLHYLLKNDKSLCNIFDNATKGKFVKNRERIAKGYRESDRVEELFVLFLAHAMATGDFHRFEDNLSAEDFEKVKQLIKQEGYEYEEEINSRRAGRTGRAGNVESIRQNESGRRGEIHEERKRDAEEIEREEEERRSKEVADAVNQLADKFGVQVEVIADVSDIENDNLRRESQLRHAKGWFEPSTNKVVIVLPNNKSRSDAMETLLHEIVGHKGMRELFGKDFDSFLDYVYDHCSEEMKKEIDSRMEKYGEDKREATDEYIAHMAERMAHEKPSKGIREFVYMVRDAFVKLLKKFGFDANYSISDNYLMYLLWKSYNKMSNNDVMGAVRDFDMQRSLGIDGGIRFRQPASATTAANNISRLLYEQALQTKSYRMQEGFQDAMLALKHLQEAVVKETGKKLQEWEDAYTAENQMSSRDTPEKEMWEYLYFNPMMKTVDDFMKDKNIDYNEVRDYIFAKSGLERNRDFGIRDSLAQRKKDGEDVSGIYETYLQEKKDLVDQLNKGQITFMEFCEQMDNKAMQIAPDTFGRDYSGLSSFLAEDNFTEEAIQLVESLEGKSADRLWTAINQCNQFSLDRAKKSGVMSVENHKKLSEMFEWYVPMRGWDGTKAHDVYTYFGGTEGVFNPTVHGAKGRHSLADDPFATIGNVAVSAIFQGNRNEMKQKLLNLAFNKPSSLITVMNSWIENKGTDQDPRWEYVYPDIRENDTPEEIADKIQKFEEEMNQKKDKGMAKMIRGKADIPYIATPKEVSEHIIRVKRNGREFVMIVNGNPRAAQAVNGLTNPTTSDGFMEKAAQFVNPFMASVFTTKNPTFIATNLSRDLIFSNTAVAIKEDAAYGKSFRSNQFKVLKNIKGLLKRFQSNSLDMNNPMDVMFKEFIMNGGETGFAQLASVDEFKKRIQKKLKRTKSGKVLDAGKSVFDVIEFYNRCAEDVSRFTIYMTSRKQGRSIQRSVSDAKEITVNFNRRGSGGKAGGFIGFTAQFARTFYLFFNAAVQSLVNFKRLGVKNPIAFTTAIATYAAAGTLMPIINGFLSSLLGGDDDDYDNLPAWTRRNNLVISLGKWDGDAMFLALPLPIEMRAFYGLGETAVQVAKGKEKGKDAALSVVGQFADMLPLNFIGDGSVDFSAFVPNVVKPFYEVGINTDWTGKPIYRDNPFNKPLPEWTKAYKGTTEMLVKSTELLNEISGGDKYKTGAIDLNPAIVEHLIYGYLGGFAQTLVGGYKTLAAIAGNEEYQNVRHTPIIKAFLKQSDERTDFAQVKKDYARYREEFLETGRLRSAYEKASDRTDDPKKYTQKLVELETSAAFIRYEIMKEFEDELSEIYDEIEEDPSLEPVNRTLINVIKEIAVKELNQIK